MAASTAAAPPPHPHAKFLPPLKTLCLPTLWFRVLPAVASCAPPPVSLSFGPAIVVCPPLVTGRSYMQGEYASEPLGHYSVGVAGVRQGHVCEGTAAICARPPRAAHCTVAGRPPGSHLDAVRVDTREPPPVHQHRECMRRRAGRRPRRRQQGTPQQHHPRQTLVGWGVERSATSFGR